MHWDIVKIAGFAAKAIGAILQILPLLEQLKAFGKVTSNDEARELAVDAAMRALFVAESVTDRDLLHDDELRAMAGRVVDVVFGFHKLLARKTQGPWI